MLVVAGLIILAIGLAPLIILTAISPRRLSPIHLVPASAGLFFGLPPLVHQLLTGSSMLNTSGTSPEYMWTAVGAFAVAVGSSCAVALILSLGRAGLITPARFLAGLADVPVRRVVVLATIVWSFRLYLAFRYGVFYTAYRPAGETLPYGLTVAQRFVDLFAIGLAIWAAWRMAVPGKRYGKSVGLALLLLQVAYVFMQGRRELLFFTIICATVLLYARPRMTWKQVLASGSAIAALIFVAFPLYQGARLNAYESVSKYGDEFNVINYYEDVFAAAQREDLRALYIENIRLRSASYYEWQATLARAREEMGSLNGQLALSGMLYSVPWVVLRGKHEFLWGEGLLRKEYGLAVRDVPNSIVAAGFADYGLGGVAIYATIFVVGIWIATLVGSVVAAHGALLGAGYLGGVMLLALRTEIAMIGVVATFRDLALFAVLALGWAWLRSALAVSKNLPKLGEGRV